ncbi:DUF6901 family protein [Agitococcus lubricus]|uniref:Uncharacterized protein n=1 Tax=Agitococcus lubricus TaxID=1077255 RepID=A0A2T5J1V9_9GAMM|nr:hypothetical protein [Agitococcus lubricus]PTQ90431.1 hypothetical protein C8N29_103184 [Agitococcus lubricus]
MMIHYNFDFENGQQLKFQVDLDRQYDFKQDLSMAPDWTKLENNKCQNCPLKSQQYSHCPAALDLDKVMADFQKIPASTKVYVKVTTTEREYAKRVTLEEGVRALMGLIMATSACPIFSTLKPNARHHLPFASKEEFILRSASLYLMHQYLIARDGGEADWELKGLIKTNEQLQLVNHAFWQRTMTAFQSDANSKALLSFFTLSSNMSASLQSQLSKMKSVFYSG